MRGPWLPMLVTFITLLLPAGGAILTVRNLVRLGDIDERQARLMAAAVLVVFALGIGVLLLLTPLSPQGVPQLDSSTEGIIAPAVALAAYLVQRRPYREWRMQHARTRTDDWWRAIVLAIIWQFFTAIIMVVIYEVVGLILRST